MPGKYLIDELFDDDVTVSNMKCDIYFKDNNYYIDIEIPGCGRQDIQVEYNNGYLKVIKNKNDLDNDGTRKYLRKERSNDIFKRQFYVGDIDALKINAKYKDGVLSLVLPKAKLEQSKIIPIK